MKPATLTPDQIAKAPGMLEATAIEHDYEHAMKGLRHYVIMGIRLMDVKERLPHGQYLPWCEKYIHRVSKTHLHRAKFIAEGLCERVGIKCPTRETFDATLPPEFEAIVDGASGVRALMADIQEFRQDHDEETARAKCEAMFHSDPEMRDEWEPRALSGELSWTLVLRGIAGQEATAGKRRSDPDYTILVPRSLTTIRNGFSHWASLPDEARATHIVEFRKLLADMPADLRRAIGIQ